MKLLILIMLQFLFLFCKKEEQPNIPIIETISASIVNDSIYLRGNVKNLGNSTVEAFGFVIRKKYKTDSIISKVVSRKPIALGYFSIMVNDNYTKDTSYSVKSFIQVTEGVYYGDSITFLSNNLDKPRIDNFTPAVGYDGEFVKIYGSNFGNSPSNITVYFGLRKSELVSATATRLLVKVPAYTNPENCLITVKVNGKQATSYNTFFLNGPIITDYTPAQGKGKVTIMINGYNFSATTWRNIVKIGSYQTNVIEATDNKLVVTADFKDVMPNNYPISVTVKDKTFITTQKFQVLSPWKRLSDLPDGVAGTVCFRIKEKIYVCTGTNMWGCTCYSKMFMEYDIDKNTWTKKSDFPGEARADAIGFSIGEKGYVGLGIFTEYEALSDFWEYDQSKDSWTHKTDFPGGARERSMSFENNGNGYILMGHNLYPNLTPDGLVDFWSYKPLSNIWQKLPDFPAGSLANSGIAILNDKLYVIGGSGSKGVWRFDFNTSEWKLINQLEYVPAIVFYGNNRCFFIKLSPNELYEYNPETNILIQLTTFPGLARHVENASFGLVFNNKIYLGAGVNFGPIYDQLLNDLWACDIE